MFIKQLIEWYRGDYAGSLLMALTIGNLLSSPSITFRVMKEDFGQLYTLIIGQTVLLFVYLADLITMILMFGLKDVVKGR